VCGTEWAWDKVEKGGKSTYYMAASARRVEQEKPVAVLVFFARDSTSACSSQRQYAFVPALVAYPSEEAQKFALVQRHPDSATT
jgi:peroxiredoxin